MVKISVFLWLLLAAVVAPSDEIPPEAFKQEVVAKVNKIRAKGCKCGGIWKSPAPSLQWNETLYKSALSHAKDMNRNGFFDHYSSNGKDIGQRLDFFGYYWQYAGENLGEGQQTLDEVLNDWVESPTHCEMLMNPNMRDVAIAKYDKLWVQHFGAKIPPGATRVK